MRLFTLRITLITCLAMMGMQSFAQPNTISLGGTYTQDFNSMLISATATLPTGWRADGDKSKLTVGPWSGAGTTTERIGGANMNSGSPDGIYNFGAGTTSNGNGDRSVGGMNTNGASEKAINIYLDLQNTGGPSIADFTIAYAVEKYRNGDNKNGGAVQLFYSLDGTTWTSGGATFQTLYTDDGNQNGYATAPNAALTRFVNSSIHLPVALASGAHIYFAWNISVGAGAGNGSNKAQASGVDDITIRAAAAGPIPTPYYFRSVTSGSWANVNSWEWSADDITWNPAPAPHAPDYNDLTISIRNGHTITVGADVTTDQTFVNTGGILTVSNGVKLSLNDGTGFDLTVDGTMNGGGNLTVLSTALGTASIGTSGGTITTNATVERYVPARRAWRLVSVPTTTTQTIRQAWQEGVTGNLNNPNPGYGTTITGGTVGNGFDQNALNNPSLKTYTNPGGSILETNWNGVSNTNVNLIGAQQGYMLFVRGSRGVDITQLLNTVPDNTDLRTNGTLKLGNQTIPVAATGYTVIGNPYAAPIDLMNIAKTNSTNVADNFYVWDPKMTGTYGVGAYVNISWNGTSYDFTPTPTSPVSRWIQSGEAFMATTAGAGVGSLVITESDKLASGSDNVFRTTSTVSPQNLRVNLFVVNADGTKDLLDGTLSSYSSSFSNAVDKFDSKKLANFYENIGISRNNDVFITERRQTIGEPIQLRMWQMLSTNYELQVVAENVDNNGLTAYVYDNFLKTSTALDLNGTTTLKFSITADPASASETRFVIMFAKPTAPVSGAAGVTVYPNPISNGMINVRFNNLDAGTYTIRLVNSLGQVVLNRSINHAAGTSTETLQVKGLGKGVYQLDVVKPDNSKISNKVIAN